MYLATTFYQINTSIKKGHEDQISYIISWHNKILYHNTTRLHT